MKPSKKALSSDLSVIIKFSEKGSDPRETVQQSFLLYVKTQLSKSN